jgi:cytosine/adenosine deaminase-related metal-dependent hydrolase
MTLVPATRPAVASRVIVAARVFDGTRMLDRHAVTITDDRIAAITPADALNETRHVTFVDGTVLPGFIDLQTHDVVRRVLGRRHPPPRGHDRPRPRGSVRAPGRQVPAGDTPSAQIERQP